MKNHRSKRIPTKRSPSEAAVDLTRVFRRAGLPHKVLASLRFAARHRLSGADCDHPEQYSLVWTVRCTLTECLPARRYNTPRGELILIEYAGFPDRDGKDESVWFAALRAAPGLIELLLPEELGDLT